MRRRKTFYSSGAPLEKGPSATRIGAAYRKLAVCCLNGIPRGGKAPDAGEGAGAAVDHSARHWWEQRWVAAALVLLSTIPLLWPHIPPLVDLPGHMGRYRVQL